MVQPGEAVGTGEGRGEWVVEEAVEALALACSRCSHPPRGQAHWVHSWEYLLFRVVGFGLDEIADLLAFDTQRVCPTWPILKHS
jgi:hypothetical protein